MPSQKRWCCREIPLFLFGALLIGLGLSIYFSGIVLSIIRLVLNFREPLREPLSIVE